MRSHTLLVVFSVAVSLGTASPEAQALPSGMVAAFNLSACPAGWSEYTPAQGRTVIGMGQGTGLTYRALGEYVGEEAHTLTVAEMPSHVHTIGLWGDTGSWSSDGQWWDTTGDVTFTTVTSSSAGGGQAHNNMMPSVVLLYCRKD